MLWSATGLENRETRKGSGSTPTSSAMNTEETITKPLCDKCQTELDKQGLWACPNYKCRWCKHCGDDKAIMAHKHCPQCLSHPRDHYVANYDGMWRDGDVYCTKCKAYVRDYDAG